MPTYYDPVTLDDLEINEQTTLYLVKVGENYSIKGISVDLQQFPSDPHTHATQYWHIDTAALLATEGDDKLTMLFPDSALTTQPLTLADVTTYLKFNPNEVRPTLFNPSVRQTLQHSWADGMMDLERTEARRHSERVQAQAALSRHISATEFTALQVPVREILLDNVNAFHTLIQYRYFSKSELLSLSAPKLNELLTNWNAVATYFNKASNPEMKASLKFNLLALESSDLSRFLNRPSEIIFKIVDLMRATDATLTYLSTLPEPLLAELLNKHRDLAIVTRCLHLSLPDFVCLGKEMRDLLCANPYVVKSLFEEGNVTLDQLSALSNMRDVFAKHELQNPACLRALRDGETTLELLSGLSFDQIADANETGNYPRPSAQFRL